MALKDLFSRILGKKRQSDLNQILIDANHNLIDSNHKTYDLNQSLNQSQINQSPPESVELQKGSLQLGIAAGYTGRALKEIESTLGRIESQMITRDWFTIQFPDKLSEFVNLLTKHEDLEQKRFESIQDILNSMSKTTANIPEPFKAEIVSHIDNIQKKLPLTPKMTQLVDIVKSSMEISYFELATRLQITEDALRGLLSNAIKRTNCIERFEKLNKGWVRYIGSDSNQSQINQSAQE